MADRRYRHGHARKGHKTPEYLVWRGVKLRTGNPKHTHWVDYGGRGITMDPSWRDDFAVFLAAVGSRPAGHTIERLDNERGYEPGNVAWVAGSWQARNRRSTKLTRAAVHQIRWLLEMGYQQKPIARMYSVSQALVSKIANNQVWSD